MKRRIYTLFTFVLTFTISALSQDFTMDLIKDLNPRNIGPAGMSGRVTSIDVVLNNTDIIYTGTASAENLNITRYFPEINDSFFIAILHILIGTIIVLILSKYERSKAK